MLKNHFKTALRSLRKQGAMAFMNIIGLSVGIACFMLIGLFVRDELSFDKFHNKVDRIQQAITIYDTGFFMGVPDFLVENMKERLPEVEAVARVDRRQSAIMDYQGDLIFESDFYRADPAVFDIFDFPLLYGNEAEALRADNGIVISKYIMQKYFGGKNPVGKTLKLVNNKQPFLITGVLNDIPNNSTFKFNFITKAPAVRFDSEEGKWDIAGILYVLTTPGTAPEQLNARLETLANDLAFPAADQSRFLVESFRDLHLKSDYSTTAGGVVGSIKFLWIFSAIGVILLIIACVNYVNSVTARTLNRNKEIGVRKTLGATRNHIRAQFLAETLCTTIVAVLISAGLVEAFLPFLNPLAGKQLSMDYFSANSILPFLLLMIPLVTLMAGLYPSLFSSRFGVLELFSQKKKAGKGLLRHSLVIFQFVITLTLIFCTQVILKQLNALQDHGPGVNAEHVVKPFIPYGTDLNVMKSALSGVAGVESITSTPFPRTSGTTLRVWFESNGQTDSLNTNYYRVEPNAPDQYEMELVSGTTFDQAADLHPSQVLISEELAAQLPFDNPLGQSITVLNDDYQKEKRSIIGVYKSPNFNAKSNPPVTLMLSSKRLYYLDLKIAPENQAAIMENVRAAFHTVVPETPFTYKLLQDQILSRYSTERNFGTIFKYFAGIAILIAALGLIGLSAFTVVQKYKEIGVRKVLGATVSRITLRLMSRYIALILMAMILATPLAYLLMENWLRDFAQPVTISVVIFLAGFGMALLLLLLTVGYQTIKAALLNPVTVLKDE